MTHLAHPTTGSTNFDDVFAYWDAHWAPQSMLNGHCFPGIVDYEEGKIAGGNSKPAFPSKGIYPNKNMEKSKLFYGVRGVRQIAALFKMRVDGKYPRVILNHRRMYSTRIMAEAGIFYLATVDNYDRIEWYRTKNGGANWHCVRDAVYDETICPWGGLYYAEPHYISDDEGVLLYGSLPCDSIISANTMPRFAVKCRVYKGNIWTESDIIHADGTIEKNPNPKLTPPIISIAFQPILAKRTVREPIALVTIGIETETEFTRTEEHTALSVNLTTEEHEVISAVTLETHESAPYAVKQTMTVLQIALESESTITRSEVMI